MPRVIDAQIYSVNTLFMINIEIPKWVLLLPLQQKHTQKQNHSLPLSYDNKFMFIWKKRTFKWKRWKEVKWLLSIDGDFLGAGGTCSRSPRWPSSTWRSCSTSTWRASSSCWCTMSKTTSARTTSSIQSTPSMLPLTSSFWLIVCKVL